MKIILSQVAKILFFVHFFSIFATNLFATNYEGNIVTTEGAWCWYADPRSLHYENTSGTINNTYMAYIDIHGNIKATQHNFITGKNNEVLIRSCFQPDDHDVPSFLILPDERVMIFYSRHTDEARFYYRISKYKGDITNLGEEKIITTANNTTYPNPFILSDDPTHIYLCWRGINWHPTIAKLSLPNANDDVTVQGPYQIVQSTGARPYAKYFSNGVDKIYLTYTTGHPDNEYPNWIYFNYIDVNTFQLKDITGNILSNIASGVHNVNKTTYATSYPNAVVDAPTDKRDWVWQTALDKDGLPVIAMVQISNDKNTHVYYYAKWTGTTWKKTRITNAGGRFHQTAGVELCYSGGMTIDEANPNIFYCSTPKTGVYGKIYEIMKYTFDTNGVISDSTQITTNSTVNNARPYIISNSQNTPLRLTWIHGNYYYWLVNSTYPTGYPTDVRCDWILPTDAVDLSNGLLVNENFTETVNGTATTSGGVLTVSKNTYAVITNTTSNAFSISLTPYIYQGDYNGTLFTMGNLVYGLNGATYKPYVKIENTTYSSSNSLGTSDLYWNQPTLSGVWTQPTKLKYFNITLTYENGKLIIYRNGLIDQIIDGQNLDLSNLKIGGFTGWIEDCNVYNRALNQYEVKKLTETSLAYTFNNNLLTTIDLANITLPQNIYTDVVLSTTSISGNSISWSSSNSAVISNAGLVTFPQNTTNVTLTATVNGQTKTFEVTVFPRNIENNKVLIYTFENSDFYTSNGIKYVRDKSGNTRDAIVYGNAAINGVLDLTLNTAAGFTTNGYAKAPDSTLNKLRSFSFLAKIYPSLLTSAPRIFDFGCNSGNSVFLRANAFTAGYKYNGGTTALINSSTAINTLQESKVAMTFDAKTKITKVYLNGTETASSTSIVYEPYQITNIASNTRNYIGRTQWWDSSVASSNVDFVGKIDDFMLYDIVLTPAEIIQLQTNATGIKNTEDYNFFIVSNPTKKNTSIKICFDTHINGNKPLEVRIYNSEGKNIQTVVGFSSPMLLSAINKTGVYLIQIQSQNKIIFADKIIVQ